MRLIAILGIAVAVAGVAFALQNNVPVTVTLLLWRFDSSLATVLLLALALGAIIVAFVSTPRALRTHWLLSRQRKDIAALEAANVELRKKLAALEHQNGTGIDTGQ
ncbi:MAG TPA: LapA family protein [Burkholderiales bacterium]|nr:LapA family protein [Burkholderiales bacterium]